MVVKDAERKTGVYLSALTPTLFSLVGLSIKYHIAIKNIMTQMKATRKVVSASLPRIAKFTMP